MKKLTKCDKASSSTAQQPVTISNRHFKRIRQFWTEMFIGGGGGGGGGRRETWKKGYRSKIDEIFKIFIDKNNRLCGHQNSCKL